MIKYASKYGNIEDQMETSNVNGAVNDLETAGTQGTHANNWLSMSLFNRYTPHIRKNFIINVMTIKPVMDLKDWVLYISVIE